MGSFTAINYCMSIRGLHIFIICVAVVWRYFFGRAPYQEFVQGMTFREGIRRTNYRFYSDGIERFCSISVAIIALEYQEHSASPVRGTEYSLMSVYCCSKNSTYLGDGSMLEGYCSVDRVIVKVITLTLGLKIQSIYCRVCTPEH